MVSVRISISRSCDAGHAEIVWVALTDAFYVQEMHTRFQEAFIISVGITKARGRCGARQAIEGSLCILIVRPLLYLWAISDRQLLDAVRPALALVRDGG